MKHEKIHIGGVIRIMEKIKFVNSHNPVLPLNCYVPDGEAHVMPDGKLYIYGSWDSMDNKWCSCEYHVVSTADMKTWEIHGIAFRGQDVPWFDNPDASHYPGLDWSKPTPFMKKMRENSLKKQAEKKKEAVAENKTANKSRRTPLPMLFAPDCIYRDGKYYLYFCMIDESEGVAISDSPVGPFRDPVQFPVGGIDPAVFIDDDGSAYLYWAQFSSCGVKLNDDMVSFDKEKIVEGLVTEEEHCFHEGSSMRKIGDTYYYVFADIEHGKPTSLGYATSKSPLGPFTYRGVIVDNAVCDPESWNNHGSIECFNGKWYVFFHRSTRGTSKYRRMWIEPITILPDGSIPEIKMTSQGPGAPFGSGEAIYGYQACEVHGSMYIAPDGTGSETLCNIADGDTAVFRYVKSTKGFKKAEIKTCGKGHIKVLLDGVPVGETTVCQNGKMQITLDSSGNIGSEQELTLCFADADELKVAEITLFD